MKISFLIYLVFVVTLVKAQVDTTEYFRKYPENFQNTVLRFKPFMVIQNTLAGEFEVFAKKRASSFVIGAEATLLQESDFEIVGGAIEIDKRSYLNRSIANTKNSETMFYISYGVKYNYYQYEYSYMDYRIEPYSDELITEKNDFAKLSVNLKVGVHFMAFEKISIDTNIGAGLRYNTRKITGDDYYYPSYYTYNSIIRQGIQPTIHVAIGLAN